MLVETLRLSGGAMAATHISTKIVSMSLSVESGQAELKFVVEEKGMTFKVAGNSTQQSPAAAFGMASLLQAAIAKGLLARVEYNDGKQEGIATGVGIPAGAFGSKSESEGGLPNPVSGAVVSVHCSDRMSGEGASLATNIQHAYSQSSTHFVGHEREVGGDAIAAWIALLGTAFITGAQATVEWMPPACDRNSRLVTSVEIGKPKAKV